MLPASNMLPLQDEEVTIEPQYDGVIMLSPEAVLFSDAKPRPDGSKVYHVFERTLGEPARDEATPSEDFQSRREQLFSQAHENTLQDIQQLHQFEMVFPMEQKRRLLKRLRRKGMGYVEFEPENHRINIKTRKSVNTILSVLRGVDPNARHLGTYRETLVEETVGDPNEIVDDL